MPPLGAQLEAQFGSGGFDLTAVLSALGPAFAAVAPALGVNIDPEVIRRIGSDLGGGDLSRVGAAAEQAAGSGASLLAGLPIGQDLIAPLLRSVDTARDVFSGAGVDMLRALGDTSAAAGQGRTLGVDAIAGQAGPVLDALASPELSSVLRLAGGLLPSGLDLPGTLSRATSGAQATRDTLNLLGGMMAVHSHALALRDESLQIAGFLRRPVTDAAARRIARAANLSLASAVRGAPSNDPAAVDAALVPVIAFLEDVRLYAAAAVRGMAFGEATLVHADVPGHLADARRGTDLLLATRPDRIRTVAETVQASVVRLLPDLPGRPVAASLEALWAQLVALIGQLTATITGLSTASVTAPLASGIGRVTEVVQQVNRVLEGIVAAVRGAFETVREAIEAIDIRRVADAIRTVLAPIAEALARVQQLIAQVQGALTLAVSALQTQLAGLETTVTGIAGTVEAAFGRVAGLLDTLDLPGLVERLRGGIQEAVSALHAVQLEPYFTTAIQIMDTTATVVDAIPIELLPDDTERELADKIRPIKQIDFQREVVDPLTGQLESILEALDEDVLGAIDGAYRDVVEFLAAINPRPQLVALEAQYIDPPDGILGRIRAIDPGELLRPIIEALDAARAQLQAFDVRGQLAPVEQLFDQILAGLDALDPSALIAPIEGQIDEVRERALALTGIATWADRVDALHAAAERWLARIDLGAAIPRLERAFDELLARAHDRTDGATVVGTVVAALLEGAGLRLKPASFTAVAGWVSGDDGVAAVKALLAEAATALEQARDDVRATDVAQVITVAGAAFRELHEAVEDHPEGSRLHARLEPLLAVASPLELLTPALSGRERYLALLDRAIADVRSFESRGLSQVTEAAQGLRNALRPLSVVRERLLGLLHRLGIDALGKDVRTLVNEVLGFLRPARALAPLDGLLDALRAKLSEILRDGLAVPVRAAATEVARLVAQFDISFVREELHEIFLDVREDVEALRPTVLLGDVVTAFEDVKALIVDQDPLAAVRAALTAVQQAVDHIVSALRPTALLAPALDAYDEILATAQALDVRELLGPVLTELEAIEAQLDDGLTDAAAALRRLQDALPGGPA